MLKKFHKLMKMVWDPMIIIRMSHFMFLLHLLKNTRSDYLGVTLAVLLQCNVVTQSSGTVVSQIFPRSLIK